MEMVDDWNEEIEDTIYSENGRESLVENEALTPGEAAFMQGYSEAEEELE